MNKQIHIHIHRGIRGARRKIGGELPSGDDAEEYAEAQRVAAKKNIFIHECIHLHVHTNTYIYTEVYVVHAVK